MASSKSSHLRSRSTLPLFLPSIVSEKDAATPSPAIRTLRTRPDTPLSYASSVSSGSDDHIVEGDAVPTATAGKARPAVGPKHLHRRKSRFWTLTSLLPSLTSDADNLTPHHEPHRKAISISPPLHLVSAPNFTSSADVTLPPPIHPVPEKRNTFHLRKPSLPNMLRKTHKVPLDPPSHEDAPALPPLPYELQTHVTIPTDPGVPETEFPSSALRKTRSPVRSLSSDRFAHNGTLQPDRIHQRSTSPMPDPRGRSSSAQPPSSRVNQNGGGRVVSSPVEQRGQPMPSSDDRASPTRGRLRKSWLSGSRSRSGSADLGKVKSAEAWIMAPDNRADYNVHLLINAEKVPELWNESANVYVHLFPKRSRRGPSFKVSDHVFASSAPLTELMLAEIIDRGSAKHSPPPAPRPDGVVESYLYLPLGDTDLAHLVAARNLFAFLTGQPLVGTKTHSTIFEAFLQVAALLSQFGFSNQDGSSYGESVETSFNYCIDQFGLADVRQSREKTLEALVLGEQMRSWTLYNEGFCHAVGKYESLMQLKSPLYQSISASTRNRLERAYLDLLNRQANVNARLESFEFPSLFAGIANSTSTEEYKNVRFKEWKTSFGKMRNFVLGYYKDLFGNWPPKARSKKNNFSQSGLNRQCLKILYSDFCALYDLLVDRGFLTSRVIDQAPEDMREDLVDPMISALRKMLGEFDNSSPPVLPPIPYDVPKIPSMTAIREDYHELSPKKRAKLDKSIQSNELLIILIKSRNIDTDSLKLPFLDAFKDFELKEAKGMLPQDIADQRVGHWLFLYVVLQSLPMLVVDAPDLNYTEGVEYFLCEPPQGNLPWMEDAGEVRKMWYQTAGQGIVELSADVVMYSVEATYMRSHCWLAAKAWESMGSGITAPPPQDLGVPLEPPRNVFHDMDPTASPGGTGASGGGSLPTSPHLRPRNLSPGPRSTHMSDQAYRSSIAIGLEPLPFPENVPRDRSSRAVSSNSRPTSSAGLRPAFVRSQSSGNLKQMGRSEPLAPRKPSHGTSESVGGGTTFDDILKGMNQEEKTKKKRFPSERLETLLG